MLHEELPQIFAVFTVVFECGVMFAEMIGDCFIASRFSCDSREEGGNGSIRTQIIEDNIFQKKSPPPADV
jgi:hypothetical protein